MANITVIGGTGYAGSAIVKEAISRGHRVTAVSRSSPGAPIEGVTYVTSSAQGNGAAIEGADVVVAALSPRGDNLGKLPAIYRQLAEEASRIDARFVVIGGFSSLRPAAGAPRFAEGDDIPPAYLAEAKEMNSILSELESEAPQVDWLFVSPAAEFGSHTPGEPRGHYRVGGDVALFDDAGKSAISGADFARAVIDEIEKPTRHKAQIHFAY